MTQKEYLLQVKKTGERIDHQLARMNRLCHSARSFEQEEVGTQLSDLQADVGREVGQLMQRQREIAALIAQIPDENHRGVLTLRYLCGLRWEQVAQRMHYSSRHLHRLHKQALEELEGCRKRGGWNT